MRFTRTTLARAAICGGMMMLASVALADFASAEERVTFDSARYVIGNLQERMARKRGETPKGDPATPLHGYLSKPEGAGPFPVVVHLHGCSGLTERMRASTGARMTSWGYVSLVVDSFATRGIADDCVTPPADRHADAMGALAYLATLPFVDVTRVALVGHAHGGAAALQVASERPYRLFDLPAELSYRAVVAYYPRCHAAKHTLALPALILIGELDGWSPIKLCEWWMQHRDGRGAPVKLVIYREAFHGFDNPGIRNGMDFTFGHWVKYDPDAAAQASGEVLNFLADNLYK
jgi:dienelactone hydrolase